MKKNKVIMILREDIFQDSYTDLRVCKEAKSLVNKGYRVSVVCCNTKEDKSLVEYYDGIQILRLPHKSYSNSFFGWFRRFIQKKFKLFRIVKLILRNSPDFIHAHDLDTLLEGVIVKIILKKPLIYDSHEDYPKYIKTDYIKFLNFRNDWIKKIIGSILYIKVTFLEYIFLLFVDRVITVNSLIASKFEKRCKTNVVMNCKKINHAFIDTNINMRKKLGFSLDDFIIIYVGGVFRGRGYELLMDLSPQIDKKIKILIVGDGELRKKLENIVEEKNINNVFFTGYIPFQEVQSYVNMSDAGIILFGFSLNNLVASPNKLFEYMIGGIPIIASNFPVMRQIIQESECGTLVNPTSKKGIMEAIKYLRDHPDERKQMGENAKKAALEKYNWEAQEKELLNVYEELLES